MASRFARPDTCLLTLANGDTLTVKRRLNNLEGRTMRARKAIPSLEEPALVMAYLVDWSIAERPIAGKSDTELGQTLDAMDDDAFDEVYQAIAAHERAMKAERDAAKKALGGTPTSAAISPSPSDADGPLTTSVN